MTSRLRPACRAGGLLRWVGALLLAIAMALIIDPGAGVAATPQMDLSRQILPVTQLPGFLLVEDQVIDPMAALNGASLYARVMTGRTVQGRHRRRFAAFDGSASVTIVLTDFSTHRFAAGSLDKHAIDLAAPLPPGAVATDHSVSGVDVKRVELAKGRMRAEVTVRMPTNGADAAGVRHRVDNLTSRVSRLQYGRMDWAADLPGADQLSDRPLKLLLLLYLFAMIIVPQAVVAALTFVRDPMARRRLWLRLRPMPALPDAPADARFVDISNDARRRLRASRRRTALRLGVALMSITATMRLTTYRQLLALAVLALVGAAAEAAWARARGTFGSSAVGGLWSIILGLIGGAFTLALAAAGALLLSLYIFQMFFGTLPVPLARSFGSLLFVAGMLLIAVAALPYMLARRLGLRLQWRALGQDARSPVLLLRSWTEDYRRMRAHRASRHVLLERLSFRRWDRFEEIVVAQLWRHGPVIALAEPGTRLPPLGAVREVRGDDDWREAVRAHIQASLLVVMIVDRTENVVWEMREIMRLGSLPKAMFVLPPVDPDERALRERILCSVVGFPAREFASIRASDRQVLAATMPRDSDPRLVVAEVGDDVSYEAALDMAAAELLVAERRAVPLAREPQAIAADLPLVSRPRGWRPPKPWYRRWPTWVWTAVLLLGLFNRTLDQFPDRELRPPVPGTVVLQDAAPVAFSGEGGGLVALDIDRPALITIDAKGGRSGLIPLHGTPDGFAAQGSAVYLTFARSHRLSAFSPRGRPTGPLWTSSLGEVTAGVAATADRVFVALPGSNRVAVLDAGTGHHKGSIRVGRAPFGLATSGQHLFVVNANDGTLSDVDLRSLKVTSTVQVGAGLRSLVVTGHRILIADIVKDQVAIVDARTMRPAGSIAIPELGDALTANKRLMVTSLSRTGQWPRIAFVDLLTGRTLRTLPLPDLPTELTVDGRTVLVALPDTGVLVRIPLP
jgi:YVTN family beta-propeller protein